ncbi:alpha/beta hydrolase [Gandjariella thermophila]|uniref:Alpha/beta hydrolase n=1 Tax=Gandjariella thermophila TaxID=1931992 RepID=A0A4D4JGQ0_9PSEU|nr:alpha/beta fold hydrolase [Gandjariella thermophila]GDY33073.1 alpha/beta hydrolase [Gandjariella thermophila]
MHKVRAYRPLEWALPPRPVEREVISRLPDTETGRPPLLFVHGMRHAAACFDEHWLRHAAERGFPAHAVSLRGHGGSGGRDLLRRATLRDYVHDVIQTAVALPRQPVLIGHSMGGLVVAMALARYPALGGVLVAPVAVDHGLGSALALGRHGPLALLRGLAGRTVPLRPEWLFAQLDGDTATRHMAGLGDESPLAQYQMILHGPPGRPLGGAPVLVVGAGEDRLVPAGDVRRTARYYGTEPVFHRGFGHDLMLETRWREPLDQILSWVAELPQVTR